MAFRRERFLPSSVMGPVLKRALRRFASICRTEVMIYRGLGSLRFAVRSVSKIRLSSVQLIGPNRFAFAFVQLGPRVRFSPKRSRNCKGFEFMLLPPQAFISSAMQLTMMEATERDGKFIAHLATDCKRLRKLDVVGIAGCSATYQTGLRRYKPQVFPISFADRLAECDGRSRVCLLRVALTPKACCFRSFQSGGRARFFKLRQFCDERRLNTARIRGGELVLEWKDVDCPGRERFYPFELLELRTQLVQSIFRAFRRVFY